MKKIKEIKMGRPNLSRRVAGLLGVRAGARGTLGGLASVNYFCFKLHI